MHPCAMGRKVVIADGLNMDIFAGGVRTHCNHLDAVGFGDDMADVGGVARRICANPGAKNYPQMAKC